ncbi:FAD-dependent oxidoreductase [Gandjariella thermophila]|uniref:FAD-dependent oxidoreductase n=1 Tax=Gandjariella thermophila TaxID=1931992 RepID=A0A4D4J318_9PSEU|nr:FAD-dependent oxidoreductase [Gandjariella thermophila]GDY31055.1 FAD-dependent oxidoreductase [Gandjariella thermophila]
MTEPDHHRTAVLVVGGGIAGLSAALFLARQGVRPILVERHPSTALLPQARAFNPRSMEIYRAFGLAEAIGGRTSILTDLPEMIGADTLAGQERFRFDLLAQVRPPATLSPTDWGMIDQDELERLVRGATERSGADVRFGTELVSFVSADDGVTATVRDLASGGEYRIHADYLVAADGNRAGIRTRLGIGADGPGVLLHVANYVFDADLGAALRGRRFLLAYLDQPRAGTTLSPLREFGRWALAVPYRPEAGESLDDFSERRCAELARLAVGDPGLDITLVPPVPGWTRKVTGTRIGGWVAHRYRAGRVFFVGDAAHVVPPSGSYGANTGIADAHNLAWKLAAVVRGQAGDALLDSYEDERRPVAQVTLEQAMRLLHGRHEGTGATAVDDLTMIFGYRYDSAAVLADGPAPDGPVEDPRKPSGHPGLRAPHVWLDRAGTRLSTLDLCHDAFTLLVGPDGAEWTTAARTAAGSCGVDLRTHHIGVELTDFEDRWLAAYGVTRTGATLVRPDGFVAWRAGDLPRHPAQELRQALRRLLARDARHQP